MPIPSVAPTIGKPPKVSVVMAVHNGGAHLEAAIESIRRQTLRDLEFIIVNDASTDASRDLIDRAARADPRLHPLHLDENVRLARALNHGLDHARAPYVARMDADDVALPERLDRQVAFLDSRPEVVLAGCSVNYVDDAGRRLRTTRRARDAAAVRWILRFYPAISHPTFVFRRQCPDGTEPRYDPAYPIVQDYDFLCRIVQHGDAVCLPDTYLDYRIHAGMTSRTKFAAQREAAHRIANAYQRNTLRPDIHEALADIRACYFDLAPATPARRRRVLAAARTMLREDLAAMPDRGPWLSRQTAQLACWAMQRGGANGLQILSTLAIAGSDMVAPAIMRGLEIKQLLPRSLRSDPVI